MTEICDTIDYKGYKIKVGYDSNPTDPREFDNLGTMVCWHRQYNLGDVQPTESPGEFRKSLVCQEVPGVGERVDYWTYEGYKVRGEAYAEAMIDKIVADTFEKEIIALPLFLYDHSGITMRTHKFSCPWDSGQVGIIYVTKKRAMKEFGWKVLTKARREKLNKILQAEVKIYDEYLTGDVYGYTIEGPDGVETDDRVCGFFGDDHKSSGLLACAQEDVDAYINGVRNNPLNA